MAITNQERIGKAMDLLRQGLAPFVDREFRNVHKAQALAEALRYMGDDRLYAKKALTEWDVALGLATNKMRSLKAIMAKLEHRFDIRFLVPAVDAGQDQAGNPRYAIPPRLRSAILRLAGEEDGTRAQAPDA